MTGCVRFVQVQQENMITESLSFFLFCRKITVAKFPTSHILITNTSLPTWVKNWFKFHDKKLQNNNCFTYVSNQIRYVTNRKIREISCVSLLEPADCGGIHS